MKYETPELTALTPAINVIQGPTKGFPGDTDSVPPRDNEIVGGYQDWE